MIYIKSLLAGLLAVLVACVGLAIFVVCGVLVYGLIHSSTQEGGIGWDPIILVRVSPRIWVTAAVVFCAGFIWKYRRLAR